MTGSAPFDFVKVSPGGNTTILILDPPEMTRTERAALASHLMDPLHLSAEQVGFLSTTEPIPRLDMMGGEFCGNATRSAAAYLARLGHHSMAVSGGFFTGKMHVSGVTGPLSVRGRVNGSLEAGVQMPISPCGDWISEHSRGVHVVHLDGITHVLLCEDASPFPHDFETTAATIREDLALANREAVGCIWYSSQSQTLAIKPVVWVRETQSVYYETACGSGTLALALLLAKQGKTREVTVKQPSGSTITASVSLSEDGQVDGAWIDGPVQIIAEGKTYA